MTQYTKNEILDMPNPFRALGDADALSRHAIELKLLDQREMRELAKKLVFHCPNDKIKDYSHDKESLANVNPEFYEILSRAMDIKQRYYSLIDSQNPSPAQFFIGEEFSADLYHEFEDLFVDLINDNAINIAIHLAKTTAPKIEHELTRNLHNIMPAKAYELFGTAFQLRHEVTALLCSENPERFFLSAEYSVDSCLKFLPLIEHLIEHKEEAIGHKLAQTSEGQLKQIAAQLRILEESPADNNAFKRIAKAFNEAADHRFQMQDKKISSARRTFGTFPAAPEADPSDDEQTTLRQRRHSSSSDSHTSDSDAMESLSVEEDDKPSQCCTII